LGVLSGRYIVHSRHIYRHIIMFSVPIEKILIMLYLLMNFRLTRQDLCI